MFAGVIEQVTSVLMLWLYVTGLVLLRGSEINALLEHYSPEGKSKGEKLEAA